MSLVDKLERLNTNPLAIAATYVGVYVGVPVVGTWLLFRWLKKKRIERYGS